LGKLVRSWARLVYTLFEPPVFLTYLQAAWELYCLEHGLDFDGHPDPESKVADVGSRHTFFTETRGDKFVPRSIFVDLDPSPLDEIRHGSYKKLFHPELMVKGKEDAANNYARGHYTVGKELVEDVLDKVRRVAGETNTLQDGADLTQEQTTASHCKDSSYFTPSVVAQEVALVPSCLRDSPLNMARSPN